MAVGGAESLLANKKRSKEAPDGAMPMVWTLSMPLLTHVTRILTVIWWFRWRERKGRKMHWCPAGREPSEIMRDQVPCQWGLIAWVPTRASSFSLWKAQRSSLTIKCSYKNSSRQTSEIGATIMSLRNQIVLVSSTKISLFNPLVEDLISNTIPQTFDFDKVVKVKAD